jgi:hypothetical protein
VSSVPPEMPDRPGNEDVTSETDAEREVREREEARERERRASHDRAREQLQSFESAHTQVHHGRLRHATAPQAYVHPVDHKAIRKDEFKEVKEERELPFLAFVTRHGDWKEAKDEAEARAEVRGAELERQRKLDIERDQEALDATWKRILENDPETVRAAVIDRLGSPDVAVVSVSPEGASVSVVLRAPTREAIVPDSEPAETPAGLPAVEPIPETRRNDLHVEAVLSHALAAAKSVFAAAPKITSARVSAVMIEGAYLLPVYDATFDREGCGAADWYASAVTLSSRFGGRLGTQGQAGELEPLVLVDDRELLGHFEAVADSVDLPLDPRASRSE